MWPAGERGLSVQVTGGSSSLWEPRDRLWSLFSISLSLQVAFPASNYKPAVIRAQRRTSDLIVRVEEGEVLYTPRT